MKSKARARLAPLLIASVVRTRTLRNLTDADVQTIAECLRAAVEGPFFPEWEFHTLFGLSRDQIRTFLTQWPHVPEGESLNLAVNNTLNNLLGYPHGCESAWAKYISVDPQAVAETLRRWRGDPSFDPTRKGVVD